MTINISWFLLNIKQHPSPISRKPQTVLNGWMAWIVCIVLFSYHKCACPMSRAIAATFWPRGRRALRARRPRGPNVKISCQELDIKQYYRYIYRYYRYKQFDNRYGFSISIDNTTHFIAPLSGIVPNPVEWVIDIARETPSSKCYNDIAPSVNSAAIFDAPTPCCCGVNFRCRAAPSVNVA